MQQMLFTFPIMVFNLFFLFNASNLAFKTLFRSPTVTTHWCWYLNQLPSEQLFSTLFALTSALITITLCHFISNPNKLQYIQMWQMLILHSGVSSWSLLPLLHSALLCHHSLDQIRIFLPFWIQWIWVDLKTAPAL